MMTCSIAFTRRLVARMTSSRIVKAVCEVSDLEPIEEIVRCMNEKLELRSGMGGLEHKNEKAERMKHSLVKKLARQEYRPP